MHRSPASYPFIAQGSSLFLYYPYYWVSSNWKEFLRSLANSTHVTHNCVHVCLSHHLTRQFALATLILNIVLGYKLFDDWETVAGNLYV